MSRTLLRCWGLLALLLLGAAPGSADVLVEVTGPGGRASQSLPDAGGSFDLNLPLLRNSVNELTVTATDASGASAAQSIDITQVSLESVVVSRVVSERLSVEQVEELVARGDLDLDDPENYNVSVFSVVLTIAQESVPIQVPIVLPKTEPEIGFETLKIESGRGGSGGTPRIRDAEVLVFERPVEVPGQGVIRLPGVIVIDGRLKSLKELFSVRLLLMNTSGIFTLSDVTAEIQLPEGALTVMVPDGGLVAYGDIPPGDSESPGQEERELIVRGDAIGTHNVRVDFGGVLIGRGIPEDEPIPFNGSATTDLEVKGPPTLDVELRHPDEVVAGELYDLEVRVRNTDVIPALYASLQLDMGLDAELVSCSIPDGALEPVCETVVGPELRNLGHLLPGEALTEVFKVRPLKSGPINSCMGAADQNISLRVSVGTIGCLIGEFPPASADPNGVPAVSLLPTPNMTGVNTDSPVVAFFSKEMDLASIITGPGGSFNVYSDAQTPVPGTLRLDVLNDRTVAVWQTLGGLAPNASYTVVVTTDVTDLDGIPPETEWSSEFTTTGTGLDDFTAPELTLSVRPPVDPNRVLPGQLVRLEAYAADQGSGIARVEARLRDLGDPNGAQRLIDQRTPTAGDEPPFVFAIDSSALTPGHDYELRVTAIDGAGNGTEATLSLVIAASAAPPSLVLPDAPTDPVPAGTFLDLTPVSVSAGVRTLRFYLDGGVDPFKTVGLAPFTTSLATASLPQGPHQIRVEAEDGLGQIGEAFFDFTLDAGGIEPDVLFPGVPDGTRFVQGEPLQVVPQVSHATGIVSVVFWLDDPAAPQPWEQVGDSLVVDTAALAPGLHRLVVLATSNAGTETDPDSPSASLLFEVVAAAAGDPPPAPVLTAVEPPRDGRSRVTGTSVPDARIQIENLDTGLIITLTADAAGDFSGEIDTLPGERVAVRAFDLASSPDPGEAAEATIPLPVVVSAMSVTPTGFTLTTAGEYRDLAVTAEYADGSERDVTAQASWASTAPAVATVSDGGRVAAVASGSAEIVVGFDGIEQRVPVSVDIVTLETIAVAPGDLAFDFLGETRQLVVTGRFSDGSSSELTGTASFSSADGAVVTISAAGLTTARGNGSANLYVAVPDIAPVAVPVVVDSTADTAPTVSILAPAEGTGVERGDAISVTVRGQDAVGGVVSLALDVSGEIVDSQSEAIDPASADASRSFTLQVPETATIGAQIVLQATASDTAAQAAPPATVTLDVVDATAPAAVIAAPAAQTPYNFGDEIVIQVQAEDAVGVAAIRVETSGALSLSDRQEFAAAPTEASAEFQFTVPAGTPGQDLRLMAYASDASGNEGSAVPVDVILTGADITPPVTVATQASDPGAGAVTTVSYRIDDGLADLSHVELYFRRDGHGTFNRYTGPDGTDDGAFQPENGDQATIAFDATHMGGDGSYEFATVGVDLAGNRESLPTDGAGDFIGDAGADVSIATGAPVLIIDSDTELGAASFNGSSVRVDGATLTLVGAHDLANVELVNGAVLTHRDATDTEDAVGIELTAWTITVDASSSVDVVGRGYLGGRGFSEAGRTVGNQAGASAFAGGSYGGLGGRHSDSYTPNPVYGDLILPTDLGSGGGAAGNSDGGDGGGRMLISAINVVADGPLDASGGLGEPSASGEGSGGAINLATRTLSGSGAIRADGGSRDGTNNVGGGGGRVAIRYLDLSTFDLSTITAAGGDGFYGDDGADGTVFLQQEDEANGELVINGQGANSPFTDLMLPVGRTFDALILQNGARVIASGAIEVTDLLWLRDGAELTHPDQDTAGLRIDATRVIVEAGSAIDVTGRGYRGGEGFSEAGRTLGDIAGSGAGSGGSHGGLGASGGASAPGAVYGDPTWPARLGGGGGASGNSDGGAGGGRVHIVASDEVIIDGAVRADGGLGQASASGDGAGGSVLIETERLAGSGSISANGGGRDGADNAGGGGGRVALYADYIDADADFGDLLNVTAWRGRGFYDDPPGSAGTVYLHIGGISELIIDDNESGVTSPTGTPLPLIGPGITFAVSADTLTTDGAFPLLPEALVGLRLNPDATQDEAFTIIANGEDSVTVATPNANGVAFADLAAAGKTYVGVYRLDKLSVRRGGHLEVGDRLVVADTLAIAEHGLLTHPETTRSYEAVLELSVGTLTLDADSRIDVTARGYEGGRGFNEAGRTLGNQPGASANAGGSYGGLGGRFSASNTPNPVYGDSLDPLELGSGGGAAGNSDGGDGGGRVLIDAQHIIHDGAIRADGGLGAASRSGMGSGGAVNIRTGTLAGSGTIEADGGDRGGANNVGGGGGRIAIEYSTDMILPETNLQAIGGDGFYGDDGGHGTVIVKGPGQSVGDLIIDGYGRIQPSDSVEIPGNLRFENIILRNGARAVADGGIQVVDTLLLDANAVLTHGQGNTAGLRIDATRVIVEAGSAIDVTGRGYRGGEGFSEAGRTLGDIAGSGAGSGGSHGGLGASGGASAPGAVYGDPTWPARLGGGGGASGNSDGGAGGGRVHIVASDEVIIDGAVRADGGLGQASASGDGAGGSVLIETERLAGSGSISANGGGRDGADNAGGGGGRVALYADYIDADADFGDLLNVTAWRGRGFYDDPPGSAGTVYLHIGGISELIIDDNESGVTSPTGTPLPLIGPGITFAVSADTLTTDGAFPLLPEALVGLRLNPDATQDEAFTIIANGEDSVTVATPNANGVAFADLAAAGKTYVGVYRLDKLSVRRGGHLEVGDRLVVADTLAIAEHGLLTHPETTRSYEAVLELSVGTLTLDADSRIDVTARGYEGGRGFNEAGRTLGNQPGASANAGGSYGGLGGRFSASNTPNPVYGDSLDPLELGSGGGAAGNSDGGDGGGRVLIDAQHIIHDGAIRADGGLGAASRSGMGSGGAVNIRTGTLAGSGTIEADGGDRGGANNVGGGGGRIAIEYSTDMILPETNLQAIGGDGFYGDDGTDGSRCIKAVCD
ncbi:hypothetical protein CKO31_09840 [Thiohalocapsa halophila]|uniref:BIG2 domain-containing protein n=1 Tax=Thiohalocapsa halophila TaxID=69359 RepID=A0ABS1CGJ8_9GAMM|nr:Ig-like domain-containing protein [Thiohalocapsa halophila]MBK1631036.1 hypothetical protein [Thiohalocapsa halophila]